MTLYLPSGRVGLHNDDPATLTDKLTTPDLSDLDGSATDKMIGVAAVAFYYLPSATRELFRLGEGTQRIEATYTTAGALIAGFRSAAGGLTSTAAGAVRRNEPVAVIAFADRVAQTLELFVFDRDGDEMPGLPLSVDLSASTGTISPTTGVAMSGVPGVLFALAGWTFDGDSPTEAELSAFAVDLLADPATGPAVLSAFRKVSSRPPRRVLSSV